SSGLIIPINGSKKVQIYTKQFIDAVHSSKPNVARVQPVNGDPTSVLITGVEAGIAQINLEDVNKAQETLEVIVQLDVEYLRSSLARVAPTANIVPIPGANNTVILTGTVANAED